MEQWGEEMKYFNEEHLFPALVCVVTALVVFTFLMKTGW